MPEPLGMWLVTSLLGMQANETLEEVAQFDGVGEFANMVCGAWLSRLSDDCCSSCACPR
jgi:CheY-specific phosphatase CheX